jgi:hypothetical protein
LLPWDTENQEIKRRAGEEAAKVRDSKLEAEHRQRLAEIHNHIEWESEHCCRELRIGMTSAESRRRSASPAT